MDALEKSMEIIANAGEGKSFAMAAIKEARTGDYEKACSVLKQGKDSVVVAHQAHSQLLFYDAEHSDLPVNLLMIHAADHLTSADIIVELADEIILMYKEMRK